MSLDTDPSPDPTAARPATRDALFAYLAELGIETVTTEHAPVFTVEESQALRGTIPGGHCKSLFLKSKKGAFWLVVADEQRRVDLKRLAKRLGSGNLSFGKAEAMMEILRDHESGICMHGSFSTTASWVSVLRRDGRAEHYFAGLYPCQSEYRRVEFAPVART